MWSWSETGTFLASMCYQVASSLRAITPAKRKLVFWVVKGHGFLWDYWRRKGVNLGGTQPCLWAGHESHISRLDGPPRLTTISSLIFLQPVSEGAVWNGRHRNTEEGGADGNCILCQTRNSANGFCCIVTSYVLPSMRVLGGPERGNQWLLEKP